MLRRLAKADEFDIGKMKLGKGRRSAQCPLKVGMTVEMYSVS